MTTITLTPAHAELLAQHVRDLITAYERNPAALAKHAHRRDSLSGLRDLLTQLEPPPPPADTPDDSAPVVQCSANGFGNFTVDVVYGDGATEPEADSSFDGPGARQKAESRARALARSLKCSWETNY